MNIVRASAVSLSGLLGAGVLAWPAAESTVTAEQVLYKREELATELVLVSDDDDDDTNDRDSRESNTGVSRATNDGTRSNFTKVSRDRDRSRSDKTRDWTRDGGDRTRDRTGGRTNDRSRNDSRRG